MAKAVLYLVKCQIITVIIRVFATNNKRRDEHNCYHYIIFYEYIRCCGDRMKIPTFKGQ